MPDRSNAQIRIGGTIDRSILNLLIARINDERVSHEYGDRTANIRSEEELLTYIDEEGEYLQFRDDQAVNGEFEELEQFLRENNIPYNRTSAAYGGYMGEDVYWVPGMKEELKIFCCDGDELVRMADVRAVLEGLDRTRSLQVHLESVKRQLQALCPDAPEMPPFKIVGEKA